MRLAYAYALLESCGGPKCRDFSSNGYLMSSGKMHVDKHVTAFFTYNMRAMLVKSWQINIRSTVTLQLCTNNHVTQPTNLQSQLQRTIRTCTTNFQSNSSQPIFHSNRSQPTHNLTTHNQYSIRAYNRHHPSSTGCRRGHILLHHWRTPWHCCSC